MKNPNTAPDLDSQGRDRNDYSRCKMCGASALDKEVLLQPSRSALLFGAFPGGRIAMEHRCAECEKKVCEGINKTLAAMK
jgi:DNA-directed RNA polymerase subunit RPC12/RpoP